MDGADDADSVGKQTGNLSASKGCADTSADDADMEVHGYGCGRGLRAESWTSM